MFGSKFLPPTTCQPYAFLCKTTADNFYRSPQESEYYFGTDWIDWSWTDYDADYGESCKEQHYYNAGDRWIVNSGPRRNGSGILEEEDIWYYAEFGGTCQGCQYIDVLMCLEECIYADTINTDQCNCAPTANLTAKSTAKPTGNPTEAASADPTAKPTSDPTEALTADPTAKPTSDPMEALTANPTAKPLSDPTEETTADSTENGISTTKEQDVTATAADSNPGCDYWNGNEIQIADSNFIDTVDVYENIEISFSAKSIEANYTDNGQCSLFRLGDLSGGTKIPQINMKTNNNGKKLMAFSMSWDSNGGNVKTTNAGDDTFRATFNDGEWHRYGVSISPTLWILSFDDITQFERGPTDLASSLYLDAYSTREYSIYYGNHENTPWNGIITDLCINTWPRNSTSSSSSSLPSAIPFSKWIGKEVGDHIPREIPTVILLAFGVFCILVCAVFQCCCRRKTRAYKRVEFEEEMASDTDTDCDAAQPMNL